MSADKPTFQGNKKKLREIVGRINMFFFLNQKACDRLEKQNFMSAYCIIWSVFACFVQLRFSCHGCTARDQLSDSFLLERACGLTLNLSVGEA
jgi:hypothetical protein